MQCNVMKSKFLYLFTHLFLAMCRSEQNSLEGAARRINKQNLTIKGAKEVRSLFLISLKRLIRLLTSLAPLIVRSCLLPGSTFKKFCSDLHIARNRWVRSQSSPVIHSILGFLPSCSPKAGNLVHIPNADTTSKRLEECQLDSDLLHP